MAFKKNITFYSILLLIIIASEFICNSASSNTTKTVWGLEHKGTIKTIKTNAGEVIDCVDIHKQPAFDHPLIKDLQISPDSYPTGMEEDTSYNQQFSQNKSSNRRQIFQDWQKYGECPEGTIPIVRSTSPRNDTKFPVPYVINRGQNNNSTRSPPSYIRRTPTTGIEYAMISDEGGSYYGASARINVWKPHVEYGESSVSKMRLISSTIHDFYENLNSIEVGWIVYPSFYKDINPKFYIYWTSDGGQKTGCYDLDCPGFVQTNSEIAIGGTLEHYSIYEGRQYEMHVTIFQDKKTKHWWLRYNGITLGYWHKSLFEHLSVNAEIVNWGGEILNRFMEGHHTITHMGSGYFPSQQYKKAAYISRMKVIDSTSALRDPGYLTLIRNSLGCYDAKIDKTLAGKGIFYGGPGFCSSCI